MNMLQEPAEGYFWTTEATNTSDGSLKNFLVFKKTIVPKILEIFKT